MVLYQPEATIRRFRTFAGGRINHTLKYAFELFGGWKAVADNYALRIQGTRADGTLAEAPIMSLLGSKGAAAEGASGEVA